MEALEAEKKLFIKARALALAQRLMLYARDELEMAVLRLQLRLDGEQLNVHEQMFKLHEAEIPVKNQELTTDKAVAEAELRKALGTLRYLEGLKAARPRQRQQAQREQREGAALVPKPDEGGGSGSGVEAEEVCCPVCQEALGSELVMLGCGHQLCMRCSLALVDRIPKHTPQVMQRIRCPTCRTAVHVNDIAYIDNRATVVQPGPGAAAAAGQQADGAGALAGTGSEQGRGWSLDAEGEAQIAVKGQYGTKLEAVVRRILAITRADPMARLLVFSSWRDVLALVAHALQGNEVHYLFPTGSKGFAQDIARFRGLPWLEAKHGLPRAEGLGAVPSRCSAAADSTAAHMSCDAPRVLLLLIKQGGKGLNLTEAQHVVLAEPQLDPAAEAQALGRVHRIGQRAVTWVHRFVVEGTVEENVHRLGTERAAAMNLATAAVSKRGGADERSLTIRDVALLLMDGNSSAGIDQEPHTVDPVDSPQLAAGGAALRRLGSPGQSGQPE